MQPINAEIVYLQTLRPEDFSTGSVKKHFQELFNDLPTLQLSATHSQIMELRDALSYVKDSAQMQNASSIADLTSRIILKIEKAIVSTPATFSQFGPAEEVGYLGSSHEAMRPFLVAKSMDNQILPKDLETWTSQLADKQFSIIQSSLKERDKPFWNLICDLPKESQEVLFKLYKSHPDPTTLMDRIPEKILLQIAQKLENPLATPGQFQELEQLVEQSDIRSKLNVLEDKITSLLGQEKSQKIVAEIQKMQKALQTPNLNFEKMEMFARSIVEEIFLPFNKLLLHIFKKFLPTILDQFY